MSFRGLRTRVTYANVMSTLALLVALTGGATAIAFTLQKNSVKSKHIAPGAVKNSDIGKNAATGDKVKESTLSKVPNASRADTAGRADSAATADSAAVATTATTANSLAGFAPSNLAKTQSASSNFFTSILELKITGFGTFYLDCETNEGANDADDEVTFGFSISAANAIENGFSSSAGFPLDTPVNRVIADEAEGSGTFTNQDDRVYYAYRIAIPGTTKAALIDAGGFDNESNSGCAGQIQAFVIS